MKKEFMILFILGIFLCSFVSADYRKLCMTHGDSIPLDNDPIYTCSHDICEVCVNDDYYPVHPFKCAEQTCSALGDEPDSEAPNIDIVSPREGVIYTSRRVDLIIELNEASKLEVYDSRRGRWKQLCSRCSDYDRSVSLRDGEQELKIRATDVHDNSETETISFFVDSKAPRISRTEPRRRSFADGSFSVQFSEDNAEELILYYGDDSHELDIEEDCVLDRKRYTCEVNVNLEKYNGQKIEYYFELKDIAGNTDESKPVEVSVDTTAPMLNNPSSYWEQGEGRYARYIYFNFDITEENFDEVVYSYLDSRGRERETRICSRLRDGKCETRKSFRRGDYELNIEIKDEAGNSFKDNIDFTIDY